MSYCAIVIALCLCGCALSNSVQWRWMSGSNTPDQPGVYGEKGIASINNYPGARYGAVGWYDSLKEEFWLFGGQGKNGTGSGACVFVGLCFQTIHLIW